MIFKVLGEKIVNEPAFLKEKHVGKPHNKSKEITLMMGNLTHTYQGEWGGWNLVPISVPLETAEIVTEENKVNFTGALGWGAVGGILTGGIGLLAGALLGGRGKSTVCALKFKDGSQFLVSGKPKDIAKLTFL